jgi:exosome complex protein LRP1
VTKKILHTARLRKYYRRISHDACVEKERDAMDNSEGVQTIIAKLDSEIDDLEEKLAFYLTGPELSELILQYESSDDQAKIYMLFAYALSSILFAHLKSSGIDTTNHPIMAELERIKSYMAKIRHATDGERSHKTVADKRAVNRMIQSAISEANFDNGDELKIAGSGQTKDSAANANNNSAGGPPNKRRKKKLPTKGHRR